ncbi:MAG: CpsD/CapB family tyrosine-protein kinase [bacterium]|nr:CpsD/CapB family tyrosine-protein kinase [bacterium]
MQKIEFGKLEEFSYAKREAFNSLRTNLSFCGPDLKVIVFTSCTPDEGKSSTVIGLARSLAEDHKKVLVIDCDLRKSVLVGRHHAKQIKKAGENLLGMSHYLTGQAKMQDVIFQTNVENFHIAFAGRTTPSPTELLDNDYFKAMIEYGRENYDVVLVDSPPLGSVIDTAVIAPLCDGAILLAESNKNSYKFLQNVKKQLELTGVRILGVILNKVQAGTGGYYNRYYQGYYKEYYGEKES